MSPFWNLAVSAGLVVPAQPVDATLTNALIRERFPDEPICLSAVDQNLARVAFRLPNRGCLRRGGCFFDRAAARAYAGLRELGRTMAGS